MFLLTNQLFGIEFTLTEAVISIVAAVLGLGALVKAIKEIRKDGWEPFRDRWLRPRQARQKKLDELIGKFDEHNTTVNRRLDEIGKELRTNGGDSLRDHVVQIGNVVQKIQARIDHQDETSNQPIFHLTAAGAMCFTNEAFRELVDAEDKDLIHQNYLSRIPSSDRRSLDNEISDAIAKKMPFDATVRFNLNGSGGAVLVRLRARPNVLSGGELRGFIGTAQMVENN